MARSFASDSKNNEKQTQEVVEGRRFFPRRCVMYVPGDNEKMLAKSLTVKPDSLVFDCEDGVAANRKVCSDALTMANDFVILGRSQEINFIIHARTEYF